MFLGACSRSDVLEDVAKKLQGADSWRFRSEVRFIGSTQATSLQIEGDVVAKQGQSSPDLYARIKSGDKTVELLRIGPEIWVKDPAGVWQKKTPTAEETLGVPIQGPSQLVRAVEEPSVFERSGGWRVDGEMSPTGLGLQGAKGRVPVVLDITKDHYLKEIRVPSVRVKTQQAAEVFLELTTTFSDFNAKIKLPSPTG